MREFARVITRVRGSKATSDGSPLATSRPIPVFETSTADETLSPEDIGITTADFDEMTFTVKRMLCKKHDISVHQSVDDRREELEETRRTVQSETTDSEESQTDTGGFEFPAASQ